jgi:uncharacterized protein YbaP (TraB family)
MHIRDERAHHLNVALYPLIDGADVFVGEMDLTLPEITMTPRVYEIREHMSSKAYEKLRHQFLKSFGIDLSHYGHLHPLMITGMLSNQLLASEHLVSLDEHLWNYAKERGKKMAGLESYEEQFTILHSIEVAPLYSQLRKLGRNPSSIRKSTFRGIQFYMEGRIHKLYALSKSSLHDLRKKIIYRRNEKMVDVILNLDHSLGYFITIGAGHLSGQKGLLSLLKRNGWKVKPVRHSNISEENAGT